MAQKTGTLRIAARTYRAGGRACRPRPHTAGHSLPIQRPARADRAVCAAWRIQCGIAMHWYCDQHNDRPRVYAESGARQQAGCGFAPRAIHGNGNARRLPGISEALHSDSEFGPALSGLGKVYAHRGQWDRVLDLMMKSTQMGYCSSVRDTNEKAYDEVAADSDSPPPKPPPWRGAPSAPGAAGTGSTGGMGGGGGFGVPKLGNWDTIETIAGSLRDP
jgi:hypothetical protein